jgi:hypothetical protein
MLLRLKPWAAAREVAVALSLRRSGKRYGCLTLGSGMGRGPASATIAQSRRLAACVECE